MKEKKERGADEKNLASFPFFSVSKGKVQGLTVEFELEGKRAIWSISSAPPFCLPSPFGADIYLALLFLTMKNPSRTISFTFYELARIMGLKPSGELYRRMGEQLKRLASITITAYHCFVTEGGVEEKVENVPLISFLELHPRGERENILTWGEKLWENIRNKLVVPINLPLYFSLRLPTAKVLMRFLNSVLSPGERGEFPVSFLVSRLGLGESRRGKAGSVVIKKAAQELKERGFLEEYEVKGGILRVRRAEEFGLPEEIFEKLKRLGIHRRNTIRMVIEAWKKDPENVEKWLNYIFESKHKFRNPAGFFLFSLGEEFIEGGEERWAKLIKK
ncbi:MAG: replication initiator protein A [Candidatus Hadarchaeales archaeon]